MAVRGNVEPVEYTETGLRLSDGSTLDADAIIWCTGFANMNFRDTAPEMLGVAEAVDPHNGDVYGPAEIAACLDTSWGMDAEGELRGIGKRHLRMDNFWVIGGAALAIGSTSSPSGTELSFLPSFSDHHV